MAEQIRAPFQTEAALIEQVPLPGRKIELRQFLKALNLCRTGQGKAFLFCGNEGIGKTALLDTCLDLVKTTSAGYTIRLIAHPRLTPEALFAQIVNETLALAHQILGESLVKINTVLSPLGIRWSQSELMQMVALLRLQDAVARRNTDSALDQLTQTIYSAIPFFKRFDSSIKPQIREIAQVLFDPWVTLAVSLTNPINPQVQQAINLVDRLLGTASAGAPLLSFQQAGIPLLPGSMQETNDAPLPEVGATESLTEDETPVEPSRPGQNQLQTTLVELLGFINQGLRPHQTCLIIAIDQWEAIADTPAAAIRANQDLLTEVVRQVLDQRDTRLMLVLSCRSEKESYTLGGSLYNALKSKMLISPLAGNVQDKVIQQALQAANITIDSAVIETMIQACKGNPALIGLLTRHILQDFPQSGLTHLDEETYQLRYAVTAPTDLLEMYFTRMQLAFTGSDDAVLQILNQLITAFGYQPFSTEQALRLVSGSPEQSRILSDVLGHLAQFGFLENDPVTRQHRFTTAFTLSLLKRKIRPVQADLSRQEKVSSLKKVLPLSFQSGELTKEKTQELLAMASAMETPDFSQFIEENLINTLTDSETPVATQLSALESLTLIGSRRAIQTIIEATHSTDATIRACACTQLLPFAGRVGLPIAKEALADAVTPLLNDSAPEVVEAAYQVAAILPGSSQQLLNVLLTGAAHSNPKIRHLCVASLERRRWATPDTFSLYQRILDTETQPELFKLALKGLGQFEAQQISPVLIAYLETHPQNDLWHDVIGTLMSLDLTTALPWVVTLLTEGGHVDWKLSILKKLGARQTPDAERILIQVLQNTPSGSLQAEVRWMAIRSLGWIGYSDDALQALRSQTVHCRQDEILSQALETALRQVSERSISSLMARSGRTMTFASPSETGDDTRPAPLELVLSAPDRFEGE